MNPAVNTLYAEYLEHIGGDKTAAASLTLAAVLMDDRASPTPAALTAEEAAQRLRVNRETIYQLNRSRKLQGCRVGRVLRFPLEEVERFEKEGGVVQPRQPVPPTIFKRHTIKRRHT